MPNAESFSSESSTPSVSLEDIRIVESSLSQLKFGRLELRLSRFLMDCASRSNPTVSETALLAHVWNGDKPTVSYRKRLSNLVRVVNQKLRRLAPTCAVVPCQPPGNNGEKTFRFHIQIPRSKQIVVSDLAGAGQTFEQPRGSKFAWSFPGCKTRPPLDIWVPSYGADTELTFRMERDFWQPPPGFSGYSSHCESCWEKRLASEPNLANNRIWHVAEFRQMSNRLGREDGAIELAVAPIAFKDVVATTWQLGTTIHEDGKAMKVKEWLSRNPHKRAGCTHFPPAGNPLCVEVNVVTSNGRLIIREHIERIKQTPRWEPAVFGYVNSLHDVRRDALHLLDPSETAFRKSCDVLNLPIQPARIHWLGVGFGLREGKVSLYGEVTIALNDNELLQLAGSARKLKPLDLKSKTIQELCSQNTIRPHFEVLLALTLKQRYPKVTIQNKIPGA